MRWTFKYQIYGHFPKINISHEGTLGTTYEYLIYCHFPKINISYHGTLGTTYKYLIDGHFLGHTIRAISTWFISWSGPLTAKWGKFLEKASKGQQAAGALASALQLFRKNKQTWAWAAWLQNRPGGNGADGASCLVVYIPWSFPQN